jgi:carbon storage regulator CsrA
VTLIISRKRGEKFVAMIDGKAVWVKVLDIRQGWVRLAITAPLDVKIMREELLAAGQEEYPQKPEQKKAEEEGGENANDDEQQQQRASGSDG